MTTEQRCSAATIYTYDSLKRLSTATNYLNGTAQRAQAYTYDGWGNLTNKTPTLGTAQSLTLNIDPATNRVLQTPACYDANGNMIGVPPSCSPSLTYDVSNRIATVTGGPTYSYDAKNKRISTLHADGTEELFFYGPNGRKLSTIHLSPYADSGPTNNIIYFAGRIVGNSSGALIQDRRGSIGAYDPWGEDPNTTGNDTEKFATYTRDSTTGLDYADQRYYTSQFGRFMSSDPYKPSAGASAPASWNRYTYVQNDPSNHTDRSGQMIDACEALGDNCDLSDFIENTTYNDGAQYTFCKSPIGGATNFTAIYCPVIPVVIVFIPQVPSPKAPVAIYCEPDVIAAMKIAWSQSSNGSRGTEAGFTVNGPPIPGLYSVVPTPFTNQDMQQTTQVITGLTTSLFHVHPNKSDPKPSGADKMIAKATSIDIFTITRQGLYEYDYLTGKTTKVRDGLDWTKPCP